MAHLTNSAVDGLLGFLSKAIKDEVKLLRGVEGDIQFIKDEMDSMNGFLMHLTKTTTSTTTHDDQVRAWMKQVRDIAYVTDDCIKLYMRDLLPPNAGCWANVANFPNFLWTIPTRCRVAKEIKELKVRVREVGKRRLRYGVELPKGGDTVTPPPAAQDDDKIREEFRRALEPDSAALPPSSGSEPASFSPSTSKGVNLSWCFGRKKEAASSSPFEKAIGMLTCADATKDILKRAVAADHVVSMKMLLCTLHAYPYKTKQEEVEVLLKTLDGEGSWSWDREVMLFSYSKLSTPYKSCLQYLTTFDKETSISRTCLVRRWVAEGLLEAAATGGTGEGAGSLEEAGERCFAELVFLGFLSPAAAVAPTGLRLKSCVVHNPVKNFISSMSQSDNFLSHLPTHLHNQIEIRRMALQQLVVEQQKPCWSSSLCGPTAVDEDSRKVLHPMDEMVKRLLKRLPKEYRLNVIDLGGCKTLRMSHLRSICECVPTLKYLSLRNTNVYRLPNKMKDLLHLQTLDIRDTSLLPTNLRNIILNELKHLLAGSVFTDAVDTVTVPRRIGAKTEVLKHVQIHDAEARADLAFVGSLERLRKLGVVLKGSQDNMAHLLRVITRRSESLRSLSVWIMPPPKNMAAGDGEFLTLGSKRDNEDDIAGGAPLFLLPEKLESLNLKCFKGNNTKPGYIPQCIQGHKNLSKITLRHSLLTRECLRELGKLKSLRCLKLRHESYIEAELTMNEGEFPDLRLLVLDQVSAKMTKLVFQAPAAPKLEKIVWNLDKTTASVEITANNISGIDYLTGLKELNINGVAYPKPFPFSATSLASQEK